MNRDEIKERAIVRVLAAFASMGATEDELQESRRAMETNEGDILHNLNLIGEIDLEEREENVRYAAR